MSKKQLDRGFEVEWCSDMPGDESGDCYPDRATYECRDFKSIEDARVFAKEIYPSDVCGSVSITEFQRVPYEPGFPATYAEYIGEPEYYEGE